MSSEIAANVVAAPKAVKEVVEPNSPKKSADVAVDDNKPSNDDKPAKPKRVRKSPAEKAPKHVSVKKQAAIRDNVKVTAWQAAARHHGYIIAGGFKKLPKKGTPEYEAIKVTQHEFIGKWTVDGIPEEFKLRKPDEVDPNAPVPEKKKRAKRAKKVVANTTEDAAAKAEPEAPQEVPPPEKAAPRKRKRVVKPKPVENEEKAAKPAPVAVDEEPKPKKARKSRKPKAKAVTDTPKSPKSKAA